MLLFTSYFSGFMVLPKVLIGCPTSSRHERCIKTFIARLGELDYPNFDVLFVDETDSEDYANYLKQQGYTVIKNHPKSTDKIGRIIENRNVLIDYTLKQGYDFLFFLDSDVIPPKYALTKLVQHNKDIVAGVYFANQQLNNVQSILPVLRGLTGYRDFSRPLKPEEVTADGFFEIFGCGFGCCLIKKEVLESVKLRYNPKLNSSEDFIFCYDARVKFGFKTYADTSIKCVHMANSGTYSADGKIL